MLDLDKIRTDGGTQSRVKLDEGIVAEYAEAYKAGATFPAITVFFDGADRWLADGFHRYFGAKAAGKKTILETIIPGTLRDAKLFSYGANGKHGQRPTNADKRKAVEEMLADAEWSQWSDRKIAEACGVSVSFVGAVRNPKVAEKQKENRTKNAEKVAEKRSPTTPAAASPVETTAPNPPKAADSEVYDPREDQLQEAGDTITALAEENDELRTRLAVAVMDGTEEEKREAADTIAELRQRVKALEAEVNALRASRDGYQREAAELRKQIKMNDKELKKARAAA